MKRSTLFAFLSLILIICMLAPSCTDVPPADPEALRTQEAIQDRGEQRVTYHEVFDPDRDYDNRFGRGDQSIVETENACYILFNSIASGHNYLYYYDKATGEYGPLCAKPECLHNDSSCNAMIDGRAGTLSYADGRLYYKVSLDDLRRGEGVAMGSCFSIALDGADRRKEFEMPCEWENDPMCLYYHRGRFYGSSLVSTVKEGVPLRYISVTAWDAETGGYKLICGRDDCTCYAAPRLFFFGKYVYFCFDSYRGFEKYAGIKSTVELWRWDTEAERLEPVYIGEKGAARGCFYTLWAESQDCIYIAPNLPDPDGPLAVYRVGDSGLTEAYRFEGKGGGLSILDGVFQRHYIREDERVFEVELVDFDGSPIYSGELDMSFIGDEVPGAVFTSYFSSYGGRDGVYYAFIAEDGDGKEFVYIVKYEFSSPDAEPIRTMICADIYG